MCFFVCVFGSTVNMCYITKFVVLPNEQDILSGAYILSKIA